MASGALCLPSNCNPCKTAATRTTSTRTTQAITVAMCSSSRSWRPQRMLTATVSSFQLGGQNSQQRCTTFERVAAKPNSPYPCNKTMGRQAGQGTCPFSTTLKAITHCEYNTNIKSNKTKVTSIQQQQLTMAANR